MYKDTRKMTAEELCEYQRELMAEGKGLHVLQVVLWAWDKIPEDKWTAENIEKVCRIIASKLFP